MTQPQPLKDMLTCCLNHVCWEDRSNCELIFNPCDVRSAVGCLKQRTVILPTKGCPCVCSGCSIMDDKPLTNLSKSVALFMCSDNKIRCENCSINWAFHDVTQQQKEDDE